MRHPSPWRSVRFWVGGVAVSQTTVFAFLGFNKVRNRSLCTARSCTIEVTFTPTQTGKQDVTAALNTTPLTYDPSASGLDGLRLQGTGVLSAVAANPSPVNFGAQKPRTAAPQQTLTLTNTPVGAGGGHLIRCSIRGIRAFLNRLNL